MPRLSVPLTDEQHTAIKVKAARVGLTQAEIARRLLFAWLAGDVLNDVEVEIIKGELRYTMTNYQLKADAQEEYKSLLAKLEKIKGQAIE